MLVLSRKVQEAVYIGPDVLCRIVKIEGNRVQIAIEAPPEVRIFREELIPRKENHVPTPKAPGN